MPTTCQNDFECLQTTRPDNWPREHAKVQSSNYACVKDRANPSQPGLCQFVVAAGATMRCCGGRPTTSLCSLVGSNVDSCEYHNVCKFDEDAIGQFDIHHQAGASLTREEMQQRGLGVCHKIDQRNHVWIGVVITLISSTVLNLGLNGQKYALRKHDERRVQKEMEMEEEHERWRRELGWTEEQVEKEADRLYEEKENRRGSLYRKLKPYMFWRAIFVSKLWTLGLLVFILGNMGGFIALRFAPQSLTAPLGSISLISNVIIAPLINKEVLGRWDLAGIFFIVAGSVMVVVFSGIVAQDYKLCVLINLFKKTETIVYLTFIGVCIIATYIFIKFVEKNVENEADMAIGVSSEKQLQQEGRLYRMQSNQSNMSLSQRSIRTKGRESHHLEAGLGSGSGSGTGAGALARANSSSSTKPYTPSSAEEQLSKANDVLKRSFSSRRSVASSASSIASGQDNRRSSHLDVNAPPKAMEDAYSKYGLCVSEKRAAEMTAGHPLAFEEPMLQLEAARSSREGAIEEGKKGLVRISLDNEPKPDGHEHTTPIKRTTSRSQRLRRKKLQEQQLPQNMTVWQKIKRIELIPTLPEHKLIRRNSPLLRFCLPLAYASLGGMMASYTVLFAKSLINLLVTSIFDGDNQFTSFLAWVILIVTVVTAVSQVYWINMGLKKYDALLQVPVFFTVWVLLDIVGGGVYYDEFANFTAKQYVLFSLGVLIVFFGVALLAKRLAVLAKEDVETPPPSHAGSRQPSTVMMKEPKQIGATKRVGSPTESCDSDAAYPVVLKSAKAEDEP
ncbi:NIPA-like protein 3 [Podila epigama]|nr:NIPA-like protein 3 [Podila epigama]